VVELPQAHARKLDLLACGREPGELASVNGTDTPAAHDPVVGGELIV
jgi:hypothetical protein